MKIFMANTAKLWVQFGEIESTGCTILSISKYHRHYQDGDFAYRVKRLHPPLAGQKFELGGCDLGKGVRGNYPQATDEEVAAIENALQQITSICCGIKREGQACQRVLTHGPDIPDYDLPLEMLKFKLKQLTPLIKH